MSAASINIVSEDRSKNLNIEHDKDEVRIFVNGSSYFTLSYSSWIAVMNASEELCNANYLEPEIACDK